MAAATKTQLVFRDGRLPLQMSTFVSTRNVESSDDGVLVSDIARVSRDGRGNFTNITDAVNAAPNNIDVSKGYFLIYVTRGVYEIYIYPFLRRRKI